MAKPCRRCARPVLGTQVVQLRPVCRLTPSFPCRVALAEGPGAFAFFLGSGASRDASVPTGMEVYWRAVGELYRLQKATTETPDQDALTAWLA